MLMRGTREHSRQQIQDLLDSLKAQGSVGGGANIGSGQFQTVRASLPGVIRLMAELVREPAFPDSEFQTLKQQQLASIEQSGSEPMARAQIALARHMEPWSAGTPDYTPTSEESLAAIKGVTLDQVRAFHHDFDILVVCMREIAYHSWKFIPDIPDRLHPCLHHGVLKFRRNEVQLLYGPVIGIG